MSSRPNCETKRDNTGRVAEISRTALRLYPTAHPVSAPSSLAASHRVGSNQSLNEELPPPEGLSHQPGPCSRLWLERPKLLPASS